jgi:D-alanyl-D-alanine carboxypeptidase
MAAPTLQRSSHLVISITVAVLLGSLVAGRAAASTTEGPPACRYDDVLTFHRTYATWQTTLVDTIYRLPDDYAPPDLVPVSKAGIGGSGSLREFVIPDLRALAAAARADGIPLRVASAYRSERQQAQTFARWTREYGPDQALLGSARPGHSEHQLGTTIDLAALDGPDPWNVDDWSVSRAGRWLIANGWRYGFVLSYPEDGSPGRTCYQPEPWHYRYVGREQAAAMRASGLTPREFLWQLQ